MMGIKYNLISISTCMFYGVKLLTCNLLMEAEEDSNMVGYLPSTIVGFRHGKIFIDTDQK